MREQGCILIDIQGLELTAEDKELLKHPACAGVIIFSRNFKDILQLKNLTQQIRQTFPHPILAIDQEGGKVQRLRQGFTTLPPLAHWGRYYQQNPQACLKELADTFQKMAQELLAVGINFNLIPVLDLNHGLNEMIGERSLHWDPEQVIALGTYIVKTLHQSGLPAVGKHFPGHGAVVADSHHDLPIDSRDWETIYQQDMRPFTQLSQQLDAIMPAHIIFPQVDPNPVTFSSYWLKTILRKKLNFQGVIISDDLSMGAAAKFGSYGERTAKALQAGCDLLLVCNNRAGAIEALENALPSLQDDFYSPQRVERLKHKFMLSY
jgi:beta-N-acetylhexosaminidase